MNRLFLSLAGGMEWSVMTPGGKSPAARHGHAAIYDPRQDRMVMFGGYDRVGGSQNDVWALTFNGSTGLVITEVVAGTPAARIGLQTNDIITAIDGVAVESTEGLAATLHGHHGGDKVSVAWTGNDGQPHSATVTLAEGPAA